MKKLLCILLSLTGCASTLPAVQCEAIGFDLTLRPVISCSRTYVQETRPENENNCIPQLAKSGNQEWKCYVNEDGSQLKDEEKSS